MISDVSTMSAGGAIAFADNQVAVGRPVADSFAIVAPQEALDSATLRVAGGEAPRAASGILGHALVSDLPSYSNSQLSIEADDLPEGYDLGSGVFEVRPDYKSGYVLKVGSESGITAVGTLELEGKPLVLLSGLAKEEGAAGRKVIVFTNGAGRFFAEGLRKGDWRIEMIGEPPPCFQLIVPENASGIFDAGVLKKCS
jgi:outer membrane usher protein